MTSPSHSAPSKLWLYGPILLFVLLFGAYSVYWFYARGQIETGIDAWIANQREAGLDITFTSKRVDGYPYRFALTVEDPHLANPEVGFSWTGETLQIVMQPWNYSRAIFRSSGRNEILTAQGGAITAILGPKSAASLGWGDEAVTSAGLTLDKGEIVTPDGDFGLSSLTANYRQAPQEEGGYLLSVDWEAVSLDPALLAETQVAFLGSDIQAARLRLSGQGFSIFGEAETRKAEIAQLLFNWGPLQLGAKGAFDIDAAGYPNGTLHIRLDEADELEAALRNTGLLTEQGVLVLQTLKAGSQNGKFFPVPLRNGAVSVFGQDIAPVPQVAPAL